MRRLWRWAEQDAAHALMAILLFLVGLFLVVSLGACQMSPEQRAQANAETGWNASVLVAQGDPEHTVSCWIGEPGSSATAWWVLSARQVVDGGGCEAAVAGFTSTVCQVIPFDPPLEPVVRCTGSR